MTEEQYTIEAYKQRRLAQRARVAQLVFVALLAGAVGASFGYLKGEVAVLTGESQVASVILAANSDSGIMQAGIRASEGQGALNATFNSSNDSFNNAKKVGGGVSPTTSGQTKPCTDGQDSKCLNKCSASFIFINGDKPDVFDCYGQQSGGEDPGAKAVKDLETCILNVSKTSPWKDFYAQNGDVPSEQSLKKNLCEVDKPEVTTSQNPPTAAGISPKDDPKGATYGTGLGASQPPKKDTAKSGVVIPKDCQKQYDAVLALRGKGKSGSADNSINCSVGASVCVQEKAGEPFVCTPKPEAGQGAGGQNPNQDQSTWDCIKKAGGDLSELWKCRPGGGGAGAGAGSGSGSGSGPGSQQPQNGVTGGAGQGMPKPPTGGGSGGGSGGGTAAQQPPQCPTGYTLSSQQPQTSSSTGETTGSDQYGQYYTPVVYQNRTYYCVPANTTQPECIFNASKNNPAKGEKIKLTWQTIGTANGRVMLSDGTNEGRIAASGEQEVTITSARTYTLTAYNAQGASKQCKVSITLGGTTDDGSGTTGAYPPKLSCAPSIMEKGKSATITWECSNSAKKSAGEGTATGGATTGKKTVTPEGNTEYTISCFNSTDANIDDEEAETFLGKRTCSVRVAEPEFDIVAYPESASRGERVRISWGSLFMKSCKVTGPRGFDYTRPNGVVVTEPFNESETTAPDRTIRAAVYTIVCESIFGKRYSADVTVDFEN